MDAEALKRAALAPRALPRAARDGAVAVASGSTPVETLLARIAAEYEALPRQLKSVAKYVEQHRARLMVDRTGDIAARCGVQPSAVVRVAPRDSARCRRYSATTMPSRRVRS
jgi:hypothetical protein